MQISQDIIQKIKNSVSVSTILKKYMSIIPAGNGKYKALCPFHNEKTPSFIINDDTQSYHCFGCAAHGDIISFMTEKEGYSFVEAVKYLADFCSVVIPEDIENQKAWQEYQVDYDIINKITQFFVGQLLKTPEIQQYLIQRKISKELVKEFNIGYAPESRVVDEFVSSSGFDMKRLIALGIYKVSQKNGKPYCFFRDRIIFPICNNAGQIVAFGGRILGEGQPKYLNSPEHKYFKKRDILFNLYNAKSAIKSEKNVIVCEGYMDVIALSGSGFKNVVAPLGTAFSESHLELLWQYSDNPIICLDGDEAGRRAMIRVANMALPDLVPGKSLKFITLPDGKDPDDIVHDIGGRDVFWGLLNNTLSLSEVVLRMSLWEKEIVSPEQRAAIMQELDAQACRIKNQFVKKQYLQYFNEGCYNFFRKKRYNFLKNEKTTVTLQDSEVSIRALDLLIFVGFNIDILNDDRIEEEFSLIDFESDELYRVQQYFLETRENFNLERFRRWLKENVKKIAGVIVKRLNTYQERQMKISERWDYLCKSYNLERLNFDYKNICLEDYEKASSLLPQIRKLEEELKEISTR